MNNLLRLGLTLRQKNLLFSFFCVNTHTHNTFIYATSYTKLRKRAIRLFFLLQQNDVLRKICDVLFAGYFYLPIFVFPKLPYKKVFRTGKQQVWVLCKTNLGVCASAIHVFPGRVERQREV